MTSSEGGGSPSETEMEKITHAMYIVYLDILNKYNNVSLSFETFSEFSRMVIYAKYIPKVNSKSSKSKYTQFLN